MKALFYKFGENIVNSFRGRYLLWHFVAIAFTYMIVISGFDWAYFQYFQGGHIYYFLFSAAAIGGMTPVLAPLVVLLFGSIRKSTDLMNTALAIAQAAMIGSIISSTYKAFTGRLHPAIDQATSLDNSHIFQFGFLDGGIFWGWPSSHTTIAFAVTAAIWALYPKNTWLKFLTLIYAFYIGIGISMTIHWFSDFVAGAIIGTIIGTVVGKAFRK